MRKTALDKTFVVYVHTTPSNKKYVGITSNGVNRRWKKDGAGYKGKPFYRAIEKYGWDNITHEILHENLFYKEACEKEKYYIALWQTNDGVHGYNCTDGGDYCAFSQETIEKIKRVHSAPETKQKHSECSKRMWSAEGFREKMSPALSQSIKKFYNTPEGKAMQRQRALKSKKFGTRVECDGCIFDSINDCAKYLNVSQKTLGDYLRGRRTISEELYKRGLRYADVSGWYEEVKTDRKMFCCNGKTYPSSKDFEREYGLTEGTVYEWLSMKRYKPKYPFSEMEMYYIEPRRFIYHSITSE